MVIISILTACIAFTSFALVHVFAIIRMTTPTEIYMGVIANNGKYSSMVGFRGAPYNIFQKGCNVANFYMVVKNEVTEQVFPVWYWGESTLVRGAGQFIGRKGEYNPHYFLLLDEGKGFDFVAGTCTIKVYVDTGRGKPKRICTHDLILSEDLAAQIKKKKTYVKFIWLSSVQKYKGQIATRLMKMPDVSSTAHTTINE